ncbi:MAG: ATP-binding protein [Chromatiaceae bacterium]|nr:ATP-binding protein [Chromatiaceae bacterium]
MLIEFRVENHRSLRDEQVLTMQAGFEADSKDQRPRRIEGLRKPLLPAAAIYGANASGKSNVLLALGFMRDAVIHSHRAWSPDEEVPRDPFGWGPKAAQPSFFEVSFLSEGIRYQYGFVANDERFLEEWLYAWPHGRKQTWFERDGDAYAFGDNLKGENQLVTEVTRPNALFVSSAVQLRHHQIQPIYRWFRGLRTINIERPKPLPLFGAPVDPIVRKLIEEQEHKPEDSSFGDLIGMLQAADTGITDIRLASPDDGIAANAPRSGRPERRRVLFRHDTDCEDAWLPLEAESQGTRTLYRVGPIVLEVLRNGGLLLVDELEASLHPVLGRQIIQQFNDPGTNPRNAQILFTTHDTHLLGGMLGDPPLRRDQVWLTEKAGDGATSVYALTDYKPRPSENLERGYLQGRYGAVPYLGELISHDPAANDE